MYDVIIIGSGPSGLTAAIYLLRANLKTLVIAGSKWGGQLMLTTEVENFPGFPEGIQGPELMLKMRKQAEKFGAEFIEEDVTQTALANKRNGLFIIKLGDKEYQSKAVLIATGADAKTMNILGEKELTGHGVSYCATCDGAFFREKNIIVVGGGDSALEEANFLTTFAKKVMVVHRREEFRASQAMIEKAKANPKISFLFNSEIIEISGDAKVEKVKLKTKFPISNFQFPINATILNDQSNEKVWEMPIDGVFVAIGHTPNSKLFQGIQIDDKGYIKANEHRMTNIPGVFVSGDVADIQYQQAISAAGFGCQAALEIERYLREK